MPSSLCLTVGEWLSTHPRLAKRLLALNPTLDRSIASADAGTYHALAMVVAVIAPFVVAVARRASELIARPRCDSLIVRLPR